MKPVLALLIVLFAAPAFADGKLVKLHAPQALVDSGVLKFALPRFSLKTQVKVQLVGAPEEADLAFGAEGQALFAGLGQDWHLAVLRETDAGARLAEWLASDVGQRTVLGFAPDGAAVFTEVAAQAVAVVAPQMDGNAIVGHKVARRACARCHAVDDETRKTTIGSTPSFQVLKTFADWENRFAAFYTLKPHPAFTQIADVTDPFPQERPSPIVPIEMTWEEVEAVLAYVASLAAADLGAPLAHQ